MKPKPHVAASRQRTVSFGSQCAARAAAFGFGVLQELKATAFVTERRPIRDDSARLRT